jgi:hypothetical protein
MKIATHHNCRGWINNQGITQECRLKLKNLSQCMSCEGKEYIQRNGCQSPLKKSRILFRSNSESKGLKEKTLY